MEKNKHVLKEEEVLKFWEDNKIFEKTLQKVSPQGDYVFYDGPPFATGTPHYGHIVASLMKDTVPRFWTMNGYHVDRIWGWDCHGLPIENIVEKEMDVKSKKQIEEEIGVEKFNDSCRAKVYTYVDEWKKFIPRMGRWVDMENAYSTMDTDYMESIWWVFKQLWDKDLVYESHRSMHICPRCETTLSQSEVTQGYKDVKDLSATAKFKVEGEDYSILGWTTTPWTLPGNLALAVGADIDYVKVRVVNREKRQKEGILEYENVVIAKDVYEKIRDDSENNKEISSLGLALGFGAAYKKKEDEDPIKMQEVIEELKGKDLVGKSYEPLFPYFASEENKVRAFKVYAADFVDINEGTGVVHIAPAFGTDDLNLGKEHNLPWVQHVDFSGRFIPEVIDFAGKFVKDADTDVEMIKYLAHHEKLFSKEKYTHSYPHCWRCDTPLLNYSTSSWFINVTKILPRALELAQKINWVPAHIKDGRFGKWLEGAQDWSISRQRFWGSVMPVWKCDSCKDIKVFGSRQELEQSSGVKADDLHKDKMDKISFKCQCGGHYHRIPDVLDCWFESGSMPFAQIHYPFENKDKMTKGFPAEFIAEGVDQTRCWFYYLLVLSAGVMDEVPYKNVIANGIVLAEDGQKMSKRLKNYPDPTQVIDKYGADAMRYYLLTSPVMKADTLAFSEKGVDEVYKKLILILSNVFSFYQMYAQDITSSTDSEHILDQWILAKLNLLNQEVTEAMKAYDLVQASRPIMSFVDELSTWYLRRSRDRIKAGDQKALETMKHVFITLSKLMAPFTPFIAESLYQQLNQNQESVHLENWPEFDEQKISSELLDQMIKVREIVEKGLSLREEAGIKVRQPLIKFQIPKSKIQKELKELIEAEVNVKEVVEGDEYKLDTELTPELKEEGLVREIVRAINSLRKQKGLSIDDYTDLIYQTDEPELKVVIEKYKEDIIKQTRNKSIAEGEGEDEVKVNQWPLHIKLKA